MQSKRTVEEFITMGKDGVAIIKGGKVERIEHHQFGDLTIKFHNGEIKQVDTTVKTKY